METDDVFSRVEFLGDIPKQRLPQPEGDWATVDFDTKIDQVVILGCVCNGDSRHELTCDSISIEEGGRGKLVVEIRLISHESELIKGIGKTHFYYRVLVEFSDEIPGEYVSSISMGTAPSSTKLQRS
jgi:hypothetical protein